MTYFLNDTKPLLTPEQIQDRLSKFNKTNDWSIFDDVPESQQVDIMYPHIYNFSIFKHFNAI